MEEEGKKEGGEQGEGEKGEEGEGEKDEAAAGVTVEAQVEGTIIHVRDGCVHIIVVKIWTLSLKTPLK